MSRALVTDLYELNMTASHGFDTDTIDALAGLRLTGDVDAVPEGRVVLPDEPILEVTALIAEAQIVETFLPNQVTFQTATPPAWSPRDADEASARARTRVPRDLGGYPTRWRASPRRAPRSVYTKVLGYHPLLASRADTGEVLHARMRKGRPLPSAARCVSSTSSSPAYAGPARPARS